MKTIPLYIQRIDVENIKTFVKKVELNLAKSDNTIPQWTLILGDNGIGKSTLLQLIAWMKPNVSSVDPGPIINDEENETLEHLVHNTVNRAQTGIIEALFIANQELNHKISASASKCETKIAIKLDERGKLNDVKANLKTSKTGYFYKNEVMILAYSASRKLGKLNLNNPKLLDTIPNFIQEKTELYDAEEILHTLNYALLDAKLDKEKKKEEEKYNLFIEQVKQMLVNLLPDLEKVEDIEITPPKVLNNEPQGGIIINTKHGKKIPFSDFSLGYKTVTSWTIDLAWRLFNKYYTSSDDALHDPDLVANSLLEPGIVLIDEIDLHLHPIWQQTIMANLSKHFPNIQFIATAHSPLMVQAAIRSNYAVLKFENDSVIIENEPEGIDGWRVDQILTSEFFGLKSSRGPEYDELLAERERLLDKKILTDDDKVELERVTSKLANISIGETPEEIDNRKLISNLVQKIKRENIKIEI